MTGETALPAGFEALAPYARTWGQLNRQADRYIMRQETPMAELRAFYEAAAPRLEEIFTHLDGFPPDDLPPAEALLYRTVLGLTEVVQSVEVFGRSDMRHSPSPHHVRIDGLEPFEVVG
jgi:hypothetical protein